jgi:hypothetical protein
MGAAKIQHTGSRPGLLRKYLKPGRLGSSALSLIIFCRDYRQGASRRWIEQEVQGAAGSLGGRLPGLLFITDHG